jgi:hypothetical protein
MIKELHMNTGIIMIGIALILLSAAMVVSPADAAGPGTASSPSYGSALFSGSNGTGQDADGTGGLVGEPAPAFTAAIGQVSIP